MQSHAMAYVPTTTETHKLLSSIYLIVNQNIWHRRFAATRFENKRCTAFKISSDKMWLRRSASPRQPRFIFSSPISMASMALYRLKCSPCNISPGDMPSHTRLTWNTHRKLLYKKHHGLLGKIFLPNKPPFYTLPFYWVR